MPIRVRFEHTEYRRVPSRYVQLVKFLDPRRFKTVSHGASDGDDEDELPTWLIPYRSWLKRRIQQIGGMPWYRLSDLSGEVAALESCEQSATDIVHFLDGEHSGQFLPRYLRTAGVSTVRTIATFHQPPELVSKLIDQKLLRWFDAVILVSPSQLPFFKQFVPANRLHMFLHGVDTDFFAATTTPNLSTQVRCITTGHWLRDWDTFRKVAEALTDVAFDVVTRQDVGLQGLTNVRMYSGVSDAALADLYRSADILFLPLLQSTANNALLEGIASGLPVVSTDLEATRAYLPSGEGILIAENNVREFISALRALQHDAVRRQDMGFRARLRAEQLAWTRSIREYEELYAGLVNGSSPIQDLKVRDEAPRFEAKDETPTNRPNFARAAAMLTAGNLASRGDALLEKGLYDEAQAQFEGLVRADPRDHHGYAGVARVAQAQWRWKFAIEQWDECYSHAPEKDRIQIIRWKAQCLIETGALAAAERLLISIADQFEGLEGLARLADLKVQAEKASELWEKCSIQFPDQQAGFIAKVSFLLDQAWFAQADEILSHVIAVWPKSKQGGVLWAQCAAAERKWQIADERWRTILARHAADPYLLNRFGRYVAASGQHASVESYVTSLARNPVGKSEFLLGYYVECNDNEAAIKQAHLLVELESQKPSHRLRLAIAQKSLGSTTALESAIRILQDLLQRSTESIVVKAQLVESYVRCTRDESAINLLNSIPQEDVRVEVEVLRSWARHKQTGHVAANQLWKRIFLNFSILQNREDFDVSSVLQHYN